MSAVHEAALKYAERGFGVLPVAPGSKQPDTDVLRAVYGTSEWNGLRERRASVPEINAMFEHRPDLNVGVITGPVSGGLAVIDLDREVTGLRHPPTPCATTGRGHHLYVRDATGAKTRRFSWGDLIAGGGYVVAPPSVHESRVSYEWALSLADVPLADLAEVTLPDSLSPKGTKAADGLLPEYPSSHQTLKGGGKRTSDNDLSDDDLLPAWHLAQDRMAVRRACDLLGIEARFGRQFLCLLPGHEETHPSASVAVGQSGDYRYFDWHRRSGSLSFSLAHVRAAQAHGEVVDLPLPTLARWNLRMWAEAGCLTPARIEMPDLPPGSPPALGRVAEGFRLLLSVRWIREEGGPAPFAWDFASAWCGLSRGHAGKAILALRRLGVIEKVEVSDDYRAGYPGHFYLPGNGRPWRG